MPAFVPPELVHEILRHLIEASPPRSVIPPYRAGLNPKPRWDVIQSFTLASQDFRHMALSIWFQYLYLRSSREVNDIEQYFPELKSSWCRYLHCVQTIEDRDYIWSLAGFRRLHTVRIDWLSRELTRVLDPILSGDMVPFVDLECPVQELDIRALKYGSPMALKALTAPFKDIVILKLEFLRVWCGLCHTCVLVKFPPHGPEELVYEGGLGLPVHYARVLQHLIHLEEVYITIPDIGADFISSPDPLTNSNENMWVGECNRCTWLMYDDETFRKSWVARKKGIVLGDVDKKSVYMKPPSLQRVRWNFWKFLGSGNTTTYSQADVVSDVEHDPEQEEESEDAE